MKRKRTTTHTQCASSLYRLLCSCAEKREMFPSQWSSHSINTMWHHAERKKRRRAITERKSGNVGGEAKYTNVQSNNIYLIIKSEKKSIRIN